MVRNGAKYLYKNLKCQQCGVVFDSKTRSKNQRYCSRDCFSKSGCNIGSIKKGDTPWNKGLKGYRAGRKMSEETKKKIGFANSQHRSAMWKGDKVGYHALHDWVRKYKGKPKKCEGCGTAKGRLEWANKSHEYKRDLDDWLSLCVRCHRKYDKFKLKVMNFNNRIRKTEKPKYKVCRECQQELKNTEEYFERQHSYTSRLRTICRKCRKV